MTTLQTMPPLSLTPGSARPQPASNGQAARDMPPAVAQPPVRPQPGPAELRQIAGELQRRVEAAAPELRFSVDESTGKSIVRITDPVTREVIQQIPSEQLLAIGKALDRFQQGLLLNRKA